MASGFGSGYGAEFFGDNDSEDNIDEFVLQCMKPITSQVLQSMSNDISFLGGSSQHEFNLGVFEAENPTLASGSGTEPVQNLPRAQESVCSRKTIMEIATNIEEGKIEVASEILARVSQPSNPKTNSEEKLVDFLIKALRLRIKPVKSHSLDATKLYKYLFSTRYIYMFHYFTFSSIAANFAIIYANRTERTLHIIDFNIVGCEQYDNLLKILSYRLSGKNLPLVKITAVMIDRHDTISDEEERLKGVQNFLSNLANQLNIPLKFNMVVSPRIEDMSRESLGCEPDEPLSVNIAFKLYSVPNENMCEENPRAKLLQRVKVLKPRVVTLVEQEMSTNTTPFLDRVRESCDYYGALLDLIQSTIPSSGTDRDKLEKGIGLKLINVVTCEGLDRIESCEVFGKWRMLMNMAGFELIPWSQSIADMMKSRLRKSKSVHPEFTVKESDGGVYFAWKGHTLSVASVWC